LAFPRSSARAHGGSLQNLAEGCRGSGKYLGMGGNYDDEWTARCMAMGAHFVAGGSDQAFVMVQAKARARFIEGCARP